MANLTRRQILGASIAGLLLRPRTARADQSYFQMLVSETQDKAPPGLPPPWPGPRPELRQSAIYQYKLPAAGIDNQRAFESLLARQKAASLEVPLAVVPGSSELMGHHTAWPQKLDGHWVEPEFRARLRHAYLLLAEQNVHAVLISGGAIDAKTPGYDEGASGFREMIDQYGKLWASDPASRGEPLSARLIVDPWAQHSETNVRNGDRATLLCGLDRNYVVTTDGTYKQGWWFVHHQATARIGAILIRWGAFDGHCKSDLGYTLGAFGAMAQKGPFRAANQDHPELPLVRAYRDRFQGDTQKWLAGKRKAPPTLAPADPISTVVVAHWNLNPAVLSGSKWEL